ncbi:hypothetical protein [Streptosporangium sp. NPDC002607]
MSASRAQIASRPASSSYSATAPLISGEAMIKGIIVVIALLVLALGMVVIWKKIGKDDTRGHDR